MSPSGVAHFAVMLRMLFIGMSVLALGSCTWLVVQDASSTVCSDDSDCGAGHQCDGGGCVDVDPDAPPADGTEVDGAGGLVAGPDGVTLRIPPGGVAEPTRFFIERETATLPHDNFIASGRFFVIHPAMSFTTPAALEVPGAAALFRHPGDGATIWDPVDGVDDVFELRTTGTFAPGALLGAP